jgi:hypothetical protein
VTGSKDPEKMPEEQIKEVKQQADPDGPLVDYQEKGHTVELIGKEDMEGTPVYKLKLTLKTGDVQYLYLDGGSFLLLKQTAKRKVQGTEMEVDVYFSNYKSVNGLMIAHSTESKMRSQTAVQMIYEKVEMDVAVDDSIFKMPTKDKPKSDK